MPLDDVPDRLAVGQAEADAVQLLVRQVRVAAAGGDDQQLVAVQCAEAGALVIDDSAELVEDQLEERVELQRGGDGDGDVEQGGELAGALRYPLFEQLPGLDAVGDVGDKPLARDEGAFRVAHPATLLEDPFLVPGGGADAVGEAVGDVGRDRGLDVAPDPDLVVGVDEVGVGRAAVVAQVIRLVAGEVEAAVADEAHRPAGVVAAAVGHAGQVAEEGGEDALALAEGRVGPLALGDVADDGRRADHHPVGVEDGGQSG
jgi:hypothetical protein